MVAEALMLVVVVVASSMVVLDIEELSQFRSDPQAGNLEMRLDLVQGLHELYSRQGGCTDWTR